MFGTQNDSNKQDSPMVSDQSFNDMTGSTGITMPSYSDTSQVSATVPQAAASAPAMPSANDVGMSLPTLPPAQPIPTVTPSASSSSALASATPATLPTAFNMPPAAVGENADLINIKHDALSELSPLVGHIDQTPTEKFRTLMMMIQGADDKSLIKPAYEAAKAIEDEKERAQALLDIVNEINYFTQPKDAGQVPPQ